MKDSWTKNTKHVLVTEWVPRVKLPTMRQGRKPKESEDEASGWEDFQQMEVSHLGRVWWLVVIVGVPGGHVPHHDHVQLEGQSFKPAFSRRSSPISHVSVKNLSFCEEDISVPLTRCEPSMFCAFYSCGYFLPLPLLSEPTHSPGCMSQLLPWELRERGENNKGPILRSHLPCPRVLRQLWNAMMRNGGEVRTSTGLWHSNPTHTSWLRKGI